MRINHNNNFILSKHRLSAKQALIMEFLDIVYDIVEEEIKKDVLSQIFSEKELDCLNVYMEYRERKLLPQAFRELSKAEWFNINTVTSKDLLETDICKFYINISVYDYKLEKLSKEEQEYIMNSIKK